MNNLLNQDPKFVRLNTAARNDYRLAPGSLALASKTALPPSYSPRPAEPAPPGYPRPGRVPE
ncbi:MAG: hypothetical protein WKG07_45115 [Hymenobacter sp.]